MVYDIGLLSNTKQFGGFIKIVLLPVLSCKWLWVFLFLFYFLSFIVFATLLYCAYHSCQFSIYQAHLESQVIETWYYFRSLKSVEKSRLYLCKVTWGSFTSLLNLIFLIFNLTVFLFENCDLTTLLSIEKNQAPQSLYKYFVQLALLPIYFEVTPGNTLLKRLVLVVQYYILHCLVMLTK